MANEKHEKMSLRELSSELSDRTRSLNTLIEEAPSKLSPEGEYQLTQILVEALSVLKHATKYM